MEHSTSYHGLLIIARVYCCSPVRLLIGDEILTGVQLHACTPWLQNRMLHFSWHNVGWCYSYYFKAIFVLAIVSQSLSSQTAGAPPRLSAKVPRPQTPEEPYVVKT